MTEPATRYTIYRLLGQGGYGKVYQATAVEPDGTRRVVALKLCDPARVSEESLAQLRDEAHVASLLSDPAVVHAKPPFLLQGMWAVEMELVDGASLYRILQDHPRIPVRPAVELVCELLRCLSALGQQPGPDGAPLQFVHRDIKPGNVQLTPTGQVKLLDFGGAQVHGFHPESDTTDTVVGTRGYIAPERFEHIEHPKGDVYALGVLLHHLITGRLPGSISEQLPLPAEAEPVLRVAEHMRNREWTERLDALEARMRLMELHVDLPGPSLKEWTRTVRPVPVGVAHDELVGRTLQRTAHEMPLYTTGRTVEPAKLHHEDPVLHSETGAPPRRNASGRPSWVAGVAMGALASLLLLGCSGLLGAAVAISLR